MDHESISFWAIGQKLKNYPQLTKHSSCDVCIVGAGIAGLMTAYLLSKEGKKVIVLDDGPIAGGQTVRTTGHVTNALDDRYFVLENLFGKKGAKLAAESHRAAIDLIASLVIEHSIDCDFEIVDAYLFTSDETKKILTKEMKAANSAGLNAKMVERCPFPSFDTGQAICFPNQAQFHVIKFVNTLCELIKAQHGEIHCGTHVTKIEGSYHISTDKNKSVEAKHVVVATNSPVISGFFPHLKQAPYRTYVLGGKIPKGYVPPGLYYDTLDPYHYIRVVKGDSGTEVLMIGGEDHRTGEADNIEKKYRVLEKWSRQRFPKLGKISFRWSGQILEPVDSLGLIGRVKDEHYMITGDSGNGLTHGILGGILINDLIHGRKSPWGKLYDPHRITLKAMPDFLKENTNSICQYVDWATPGEKIKFKSHCGEIVREGLSKCAVYKDEHGKVHKMSAVCPHKKALVRWNEAEHCWECPVHGSRFNAIGEVTQGPANENLKKV